MSTHNAYYLPYKYFLICLVVSLCEKRELVIWGRKRLVAGRPARRLLIRIKYKKRKKDNELHLALTTLFSFTQGRHLSQVRAGGAGAGKNGMEPRRAEGSVA